MHAKKNNSRSGPLMCWDLYLDSYYRRLLQAECLDAVRSFAQQHHWRVDWNLEQYLIREERVALVTDTAQVIRFATPNLVHMNGYEPAEVIGLQPKMFQGKDTDPLTRSRIREAIQERLPFKGSLINYRKNGTPYNCLVEEYPVWNTGGELVHFVAFEKVA